MTLREKICVTTAKTLREFFCLPCSNGDGEIIYVPFDSFETNLIIEELNAYITYDILDANLEK